MPVRAEQIQNAVLASVNQLIAEFRPNPFRFLCEADLQAALFSSVRSKLDDDVPVKRAKPGGLPDYRVRPVAMEYRTFGKSYKVDIACIDPDREVPAAASPCGRFDVHPFSLPLLVAVELKYLLMGYADDLVVKCDADRLKLTELQNDPDRLRALRHGLVLGFIQDLDGDRSRFRARCAELTRVEGVTDLDGTYLISAEGVYRR